jgi:hypothetical protein
MITQKELDEMQARCDAATPGEWVVGVREYSRGVLAGAHEVAEVSDCDEDNGVSDAAFIAKVRTDMPRLIAEVKRLREVISDTHETYCDESWTDRGLHAPECMAYTLGDE